MTKLPPGHWHRFDMMEQGIVVDYECPACKNMFHVDGKQVALNGIIAGGSIHCNVCGFHDFIQLIGWTDEPRKVGV